MTDRALFTNALSAFNLALACYMIVFGLPVFGIGLVMMYFISIGAVALTAGYCVYVRFRASDWAYIASFSASVVSVALLYLWPYWVPFYRTASTEYRNANLYLRIVFLTGGLLLAVISLLRFKRKIHGSASEKSSQEAQSE